MTHDEALARLSDFLYGNLPHDEHQILTQMLEKDSELRQAFEEEKILDGLLRTQEWVHVKPDFTVQILGRVGLSVVHGETVLDKFLERLSAYAPVGTLALVVLFYGQPIAKRLWGMWEGVLAWADKAIGLGALHTNPGFAAASLAVLTIAVVTTIELGRRGRSSFLEG
jgi:ABC-type dipeptide/oligopeptide/nickel transport system permease component